MSLSERERQRGLREREESGNVQRQSGEDDFRTSSRSGRTSSQVRQKEELALVFVAGAVLGLEAGPFRFGRRKNPATDC